MKQLLGILAIAAIIFGTVIGANDLLAIGIFIPLIYKHFKE